jgi:hypothetical protein
LEGSSRSVVTKTSGPGTLKSMLMILEKTKEMLVSLMKIHLLLMQLVDSTTVCLVPILH